MLTTPSTYRPAAGNIQLLRIYNYYRLFIGCLLGAMFWSGIAANVLGTEYPDLFHAVVIVYIVTSMIGLLLFWCHQLHPYTSHVSLLLSIDFIAFSVIIYASGGVDSSMSYLLLISMAIGSIIIHGQAYIALAAFAALLVLLMSAFKAVYGGGDSHSIFAAGITGILLFITAFSFHFLTQKIQASEQAAVASAQYAANFQQRAQLIVERMRTGIVIVNQNLNVELINAAAKHLLMPTTHSAAIEHIPGIDDALSAWRQGVLPSAPLTLAIANGTEVKVSFSAIDDPPMSSLMLFIDDIQQLNQQVQQLKLASLGRLTASIAHEIRNPLGAISHAGQLLGESSALDREEYKLITMIQNHCQRIDHIINNVLNMSRRKDAVPEIIDLNQWVKKFTEEYLRHKPGSIHLEIPSDAVLAKIDQSHLHQVMTNIVDNGVRYSRRHSRQSNDPDNAAAQVRIRVGIDAATDLPYIDVIDNGKGIDDALLPHIFEPFFTTETTGTGLGLYLSKELCQANQAKLSYYLTEKEQKNCFRIQLSHHKRHM